MPALVLDTNMLFLFIVGTIDQDLLGRMKRLKNYRPDDYGIIETYIGLFDPLILLPNVVTETSNFIGQISGKRREICLGLLADLIEAGSERYVSSSMATRQAEYLPLGLTDAAILCALDHETNLLTADHRLYAAAAGRGMGAEYFEYLRA